MKSIEQIKEELQTAKARLKEYEREETEYNGDRGAEHYMFLMSVKKLRHGVEMEIRSLEKELNEQQENREVNQITSCGL